VALHDVPLPAAEPAHRLPLQAWHVPGLVMYVQAMLHLVHTAHRGHSLQQAIDLVMQDRSVQSHTALFGPHVYGAWVAHQSPELRPHTLG
jgi:hypothetical protein